MEPKSTTKGKTIAILVSTAILVLSAASFILNLGLIRVIIIWTFTAIGLVIVALFKMNIEAQKYFRYSRTLLICNIVYNFSFALAWLLLPDLVDSGERYAFFGLITVTSPVFTRLIYLCILCAFLHIIMLFVQRKIIKDTKQYLNPAATSIQQENSTVTPGATPAEQEKISVTPVSLLLLAISMAAFILGAGWIRIIMVILILPIVGLYVLFKKLAKVNSEAEKYFRFSTSLRICNILCNLFFVLAWLLLPDFRDRGGGIVFFGLIKNANFPVCLALSGIFALLHIILLSKQNKMIKKFKTYTNWPV